MPGQDVAEAPVIPSGGPFTEERRAKNARVWKDLIAIAGGAALLWAVAVFANLSGLFDRVARPRNDLSPADLNLAVLLLALGLAVFAFRRWKDLREEVARRTEVAGELRRANDSLHALLQASPAAIITLDEDGKVRTWNPAAERIFGFTPDEAIGHPLPCLPAEGEAEFREIRRRELLGESLFNLEMRRERKDGAPITVSLSTAPLHNAKGEVSGTMGVILDVTETKRAEEELRREAARTQALLHVASRLNSRMEMEDVLQTICEETAHTLDVPIVLLRLYDPRKDQYNSAVEYGLSPGFGPTLPPKPGSLLEKCFKGDDPVAVFHNVQNYETGTGASFHKTFDLQSVASVKMLRNAETIGILSIATKGKERQFSPDELTLLKGLSDLAVESIVNARLFAEAKRRQDLLRALRIIDVSISGSLDVHVTLSVILDQTMRHLDLDAACVLLYHPPTDTLEYAAGRGFNTKLLRQSRLSLGEGVAGEVALNRVPRTVPDLRDSPDVVKRQSLFEEEGFVAYTAVPLVSKGQLQGVMEVFHREPFDTEPEWMGYLEMLAGQAAIAIDSASMFDEIQLTNIELTLAHDITLEGWVKALDLRDKETEGHTQRVTEMSLDLAASMGMNDEELVYIRRGALLHDIGKIGIPDSILLKPGPLDMDERALMEMHTVYAYEFLSPIPYLLPALDIPYCHHERWDGGGYPRGLKEEEIPLSARIFAVVDVWDSLRSNRPYRQAWPEEKVREYLRALSGIQFDPAIVKEFLNLIRSRRDRVNEAPESMPQLRGVR